MPNNIKTKILQMVLFIMGSRLSNSSNLTDILNYPFFCL